MAMPRALLAWAVVGSSDGFAPAAAGLGRRGVPLGGIAGFGTFFAETWLGRDACQMVSCPPKKGTFDHVLIDVNQFVHTSTRRATSEEDAVRRLMSALDGVLRVARPTQSLVLALDGAAPIAKIVTQRRRREAAASKASSASASDAPRVSPLLITPGTAFMDLVSEAVEYYAESRLARRESLANVTAYVSCVRHGGEGELKLVEWLGRRGVSGTAAVVSGDADVVLQSLAALPLASCGGDGALLEPFVLRPLERPRYGVVSSWQLARGLARRFPSAALRKTRDDVLVLLLLQGNDYVPRLRRASFKRCLECYERTKFAFPGGDPRDEGHFFAYENGRDRVAWRADFAAAFFERLGSAPLVNAEGATAAASIAAADDLVSLHELEAKGKVKNLTFDFKMGRSPRPVWTCLVRGYDRGLAASASTKVAARRLAAAKVLRSLDLDASDAGDGPVPRLRRALNASDLAFDFTPKAVRAEARQATWTCAAAVHVCDPDDDDVARDVSATAHGATKKAAKAAAARALHAAAFGENKSPDAAAGGPRGRRDAPASARTAPDPAGYVRGLAWSLDMYVTGATDDGSFRYAGRAPSARDVAAFFAEPAATPARDRKNAKAAPVEPPLSADVHCCAVMPKAAAALLPEHLQPLHAFLCEARDQGVDADDLAYLQKVVRTLSAANTILGGGDSRAWTTFRRRTAADANEPDRRPPPRPNNPAFPRSPLPDHPKILVRSDTQLPPGPPPEATDDRDTAVDRQKTNRDLRARSFHTAFRRPHQMRPKRPNRQQQRRVAAPPPY